MRLQMALLAVGLLAGPAAPAPAQDYAGQQACVGCHPGVLESYAHTVHARALTPGNALGALARHGCESCHGPGSAHVASAGREGGGEGWVTFQEIGPDAARAKSRACLQCHAGDRQRHWEGSAHESRGLDCISCHAVKKVVSDRHLLSRPTETEVCSQCHSLAGAQTRRLSHMPMRTGARGAGGEGNMTCASCHNSHGSIAEKLVDGHTVNDSCTSCHADKRGPFLWEHAPVSESCLNCHVAHGSLKPNMLRISAPRLCQTCHIAVLHASEARLPRSRFVVGQSCMNCHSQVHGSNHPSGAFFTR